MNKFTSNKNSNVENNNKFGSKTNLKIKINKSQNIDNLDNTDSVNTNFTTSIDKSKFNYSIRNSFNFNINYNKSDNFITDRYYNNNYIDKFLIVDENHSCQLYKKSIYNKNLKIEGNVNNKIKFNFNKINKFNKCQEKPKLEWVKVKEIVKSSKSYKNSNINLIEKLNPKPIREIVFCNLENRKKEQENLTKFLNKIESLSDIECISPLRDTSKKEKFYMRLIYDNFLNNSEDGKYFNVEEGY